MVASFVVAVAVAVAAVAVAAVAVLVDFHNISRRGNLNLIQIATLLHYQKVNRLKVVFGSRRIEKRPIFSLSLKKRMQVREQVKCSTSLIGRRTCLSLVLEW